MREILFLILITFNTVASGTNYYVSNTGNDNSNGQSPATAWKTLKNVNSQKFNPRDSILFERGGIWNENLEITSSGNSAGQIIYSAYGSGDKPVLNGIGEVEGWTTAGNWTNMGNNVWRIYTSSPGIYGRVWINGVEKERSRYGAEGVGITAEYPWQKINNRLYIHSTANPSGAFSSIKMTSPLNGLTATNKDYITINNIEFKGWQSTELYSCSNWIIEYSDFISSGMRGIFIRHNNGALSKDGVIRYCNFDTEYPFYITRIQGVDTGSWVYLGTEFAIKILSPASNWDVHNNHFKGWGYVAFWSENHSKNGRVAQGLRFYKNDVDCSGLNYGRAFAGHHYVAQVNENNPIEVFDNYIYEQAVPSQIGVPFIKVYNNVFNKTTGTDGNNSNETAAALSLFNYEGRPPYKAKIFNNVFAYGGWAGMFWNLTGPRVNTPYEDIEVVNNIFYENGEGKSWQQFRISDFSSSVDLINPRIENNIFYASARTDIIYVLNSRLTVAQFNALDGTNHQQLNPQGNIQADPLFVDPLNGDFRLQEDSPAIGAGLTPLSGKDMAGNEWGDKPGIGPYAIAKSTNPEPAQYFTLSLENEGNGKVLSNGKEENLITVGYDTTITMEAIPDSGWTFSNWAGDVSGSANPLEITINEDKNIKAIFTEETYTLTIICEGEGEVKIFPAQESYASGVMINLEALAEEQWEFHEWEGDLISADTQTSFVIEKNMRIIASFNSLTTNSNLISEKQKNIHIYPNPARGFFSISAEESAVKPDGFNIIDLSGRIVYTDILNRGKTIVQIPGNLRGGVYIIELFMKGLPFYSQRLIIRN